MTFSDLKSLYVGSAYSCEIIKLKLGEPKMLYFILIILQIFVSLKHNNRIL